MKVVLLVCADMVLVRYFRVVLKPKRGRVHICSHVVSKVCHLCGGRTRDALKRCLLSLHSCLSSAAVSAILPIVDLL